MRCSSVLLLSVLLAMPAADLLNDTLAKMDAAAAGFKGLTADVKKVAYTAVIQDENTDTGTMSVKRSKPHELRALIEIKKPDPKLVGFSDRTAQIYYPKTKTVQVVNLDKKSSTLVDQLLLLGFGSTSAEIGSGYNIKLGGPDNVNGQAAVRLELTPKSPEKLPGFTRIDLWISDSTGMAVQQKFLQTGGDYTMATYSNMKLVSNLPDAAVKLELPKDVHREIVH
jgi:outer membrane lipoprotein-sorting protein